MADKPRVKIESWRLANTRTGQCLCGVVGDEMVQTSNLVSFDRAAKIAVTQNTIYELGHELPSAAGPREFKG